MAGFQIQTASGVLTVQARQRSDGSWAMEVDASPARKTPVGPPEKLSVGTGAVVTLTPPAGATEVQVFVEQASDVRYYDDGSTPTTGANGNGAGIPAGAADQFDYTSFANLKLIAVSATVNVQALYYRAGP